MKKFKILVLALVIILIGTGIGIYKITDKEQVKAISSVNTLKRLYNYGQDESFSKIITKVVAMPWSILTSRQIKYSNDISFDTPSLDEKTTVNEAIVATDKNYSSTNIQVENVDEADITKTDGKYIYSISENNVIITNAKKAEEIKIASKITPEGIPEDLILYNNKLVVISEQRNFKYYSEKNNTIVEIYNVEDKEKPTKVKSYKLYEPYYTSRCINNRLYIISSGNLRKEKSDIITYYTEDNKNKEINLDNMYYIKKEKCLKQTLIASTDLNNPEQDISLQSYLIDINNAYVSENNIYLLSNQGNYGNNQIPISSLFTWKGAIGPFLYGNSENNYSNYKTVIYKFNITKDGLVKYDTKTKISGKTINQFSLDEYNENLRVALYDNNGSKIVILNNKLQEIGKTSYLAEGEKMYASRFIGNKAYLVTYKTIDPLYVIDLTNPENPTVLGELKIPGYSTYLHPYDENHIIGIGMETKETTRRDSNGKVISTSATTIGMKMALFDVTNVNNPIQISSTVIGDRKTSSAILTNHKALLFSKEKELIAIPVNNYAEDVEIDSNNATYSESIQAYNNYNKPYIAEGYLVYKINLKDGFNLRGTVTHKLSTARYNYETNSRLLRGLYINNNLFTISEDEIKVNNLDNMNLVAQLELKNMEVK